MYSTLITAGQLQALLAQGTPVRIFDCTADLTNPAAGVQHYETQHIAGALHADLDTRLSDKASADTPSRGRHPLPQPARFAQWLRSAGLRQGMQVVVYDRNGANFCGRLWWMLKWVGHEAVAVLDGGLQAWQAGGGACETGAANPPPEGDFEPGAPRMRLAQTAEVLQGLGGTQTIIDARAAPRYRGEVEPLDPVAGHIPGALNRPFGENIAADGRFKPPELLRAEFLQLLGGREPATVVHHCGSGVSAVPNVLAMEIAGLGSTALYAGSWSEWCADPARPVARG